MRFGVLLTPIYDASVDPARQIAEHEEVVRTADQLGFDILVAGQHFLGNELRFYQPVPYLTHMSRLAPRMDLLTGVVLLSLVNPVDIAEQMATMDALTGGRAIFGVGLGYSDHEFGAFGMRRQERVRRFEESVALVRQLWSGKPVDFEGEFFQVHDVTPSVLPVRPGGIPIWIGAQASPSARRAGRIGDAWYVAPFPSHEELKVLRREELAERAAAGSPLDGAFPVRRDVVLAPTRAEALQMAVDRTKVRYRTYKKWGLEGNASALADDSAAQEIASRFVLGDAATCVEHLAGLRDDLGMTEFVFKAHWPGLDHRSSMQQLELFGTDVMPHLR